MWKKNEQVSEEGWEIMDKAKLESIAEKREKYSDWGH